MIGSRLVTKQTGPAGAPVSKVLVQQGLDIVQEFYVGFLIDRKLQKPVLIASAEGGMEIEKVAAQFPEKIIKTVIDPVAGLSVPEALEVATRLDVPADIAGRLRRSPEKVMEHLRFDGLLPIGNQSPDRNIRQKGLSAGREDDF